MPAFATNTDAVPDHRVTSLETVLSNHNPFASTNSRATPHQASQTAHTVPASKSGGISATLSPNGGSTTERRTDALKRSRPSDEVEATPNIHEGNNNSHRASPMDNRSASKRPRTAVEESPAQVGNSNNSLPPTTSALGQDPQYIFNDAMYGYPFLNDAHFHYDGWKEDK